MIELRLTEWHKDALCAGHPDPDLWHYENTRYPDEQKLQVLRSVEAIAICNQCPVKAQCLQQGLEDENLSFAAGCGSIFGGLMMAERYALKHGARSNIRRISPEDRHIRAVKRKQGMISK
jgi:hypothetical protein